MQTKDDFEVYYDPTNSHAATHFNDPPRLRELVVELLRGLEVKGKEIIATHLAPQTNKAYILESA